MQLLIQKLLQIVKNYCMYTEQLMSIVSSYSK